MHVVGKCEMGFSAQVQFFKFLVQIKYKTNIVIAQIVNFAVIFTFSFYLLN